MATNQQIDAEIARRQRNAEIDAEIVRRTQAAQVLNEDVPTPENLAIPAPGLQERTLGENIVGVGEAALTAATGATTGALGFLASAPDAALNELRGQEGSFDNANAMAAQNTFSPRTEAGKEFVKIMSETLGTIPPVLGSGGMPAAINSSSTAGRFANSKLFKDSRAKRQVVSDEIREGNINAGNIAKTLNEDGKLITNPNVKLAVKLMGDDEASLSTAINFEKMNNATRFQVNKMLDTIQTNKDSMDPVFTMENRPSNIIGDSLAARVGKLNSIKKSASADISNIINGATGNKTVDVKSARDNFISDLFESDITIGRNNEGLLLSDSSKTLTNIDEVIGKQKLNNILSRIESGQMNAKQAHKLKRNIRELVSYDPSSPGSIKVSADIERAIKKLSTGLGDSISKVDNNYLVANKKFSESINDLIKADKILGNKLMIGDDLAASKFGDLSKRIGTNLASRQDVLSLVQTLDESLAKRGVRPKDDIKRQVATLVDLDKIFKLELSQAPSGFTSRIAQATGEAALGGGVLTGSLLSAAKDKFLDMGKLEFDDKMKALRFLSKKKTEGKK
jgi:phage host-nuclease inhibitor protein Gam